MKLAILFWFYKEPEICLNRLELIKKYNPDLQIFGLYGGEHSEEKKYKNILGEYLDDFYMLENQDSDWKWLNGDLALQERYKNRGEKLEFDSVYIIQWDNLIFEPLEKMFHDYKKDQVFFSGTEVLSKDIEAKWNWTSKPEHRPDYLKFKEYIKNKYNYADDILCCLPMFEILPKIFFEKYGEIEHPELGFIEYRKPTYAKILGFDFYKKDLGVWWFQDKSKRPMNAAPIEIKREYILDELDKKDGRKMFHPYYKKRDN